jgi:Flp pilus assembly pilin Flp
MMNQYLSKLGWLEDEQGQNLAEYGLLLGLVAVVVMAVVAAIGGSIFEIFDSFAVSAEGWTRAGTA